MPLAADEVLLYPRRRRYFVDICIGLVNNHRSGYRKNVFVECKIASKKTINDRPYGCIALCMAR